MQHVHPLHLVLDPFSGLGVYQPVHDELKIPDQSTFETDPNLKARLQGAKIDGFEGIKMLELKINRKLKSKDMSPIRLADECAGDLEIRMDDQYTLFKEIIKLYAPPLLQSASYKATPAQAAYSQTMQQILASQRGSSPMIQNDQQPSLTKGVSWPQQMPAAPTLDRAASSQSLYGA